ncbi:MAG: helix-turn-helix domain-containing protein [Roseofilum sp. Belize BBD 4]|nr:helix-turn-helix domain-containing protein [Roseofilum sp. Belize BBD 4]
MNQKDFMKAVGFNEGTYRRWINERTVPKYTAEQLAAICEVCRIDGNTLLDFLAGEIDLEELPNN